MKKMVLLVIGIIIPLAFVSCKEKSCSFEYMEYDASTKQCECVQLLDIENAPVLKHNDYNTVLAVNQNFYYASLDNQNYPYYSYEGDTIMFYGNVGETKSYSSPDSTWVGFTIYDTNGGYGVGHSLTVECLASQLEEIDMVNPCYVTGVLTFDWNTSHVMWPSAALGPGHCESRSFFFSIMDIHN